ncbi:MAG: EAL domain-containing protein [Alphaproteobacteria bacterium]|nr:EAL domain-containing protein [Alphaproteobacteria bacterium]
MAMTSSSRPGKGPSQEYLLLDYVNRLARDREGRRAVHIYLSRLRSYHRQDHHVRIAAATFEPMVQAYEGQIIVLSNSDIFFTCKGASEAEIQAAITKVRLLFSEDPVTQGDSEADLARFCTSYDLATQYDEMVKAVQALHKDRERKMRLAVTSGAEETAGPKKGGQKAIDPDQLDRLEAFLSRADLSNLMRRQPVVALTQSGGMQTVFQELYISITDLQNTVLPDVNIASSLWLFQHLTRTLDNRMLSLLVRNDDSSIASAISINLNISTILSPAFLNFDSSLKAVARGTMVVELQKIDIFGDMGAYFFARDFLRERGYRVCLDGLGHMTMQFIDRERLGLDLIKLVWTADMADDLTGKRQVDLKQQIERTGRARIILCRCDSDEAVRFGQSVGVNMFQGRHVDKMLTERRI